MWGGEQTCLGIGKGGGLGFSQMETEVSQGECEMLKSNYPCSDC